MKKIIISLLLLVFAMPVFSMEFMENRAGKEEELVQRVGFTLLNANKIPYRMIFRVVRKNNIINAATYYNDKTIKVYKGILLYLDNEDELAAILAHEISHGVDYSQGAFKGYFSYISTGLNSKKYEEKADKRAVDYLVKAGYHPIAFIVAANKIFSQPRYDWYLSHPTGSKRLMNVYEYIYVKYPEYLVNNPYKDNVFYQNFLVTSKENRKKLEQKVKTNSSKKIKYQ